MFSSFKFSNPQVGIVLGFFHAPAREQLDARPASYGDAQLDLKLAFCG
jgi:hypothetical protein